MNQRPITFEQACRLYPHRFTLTHVPAWARIPCDGRFYAPQYSSDREWFERTEFAGESEMAGRDYCHSTGQTWPLGKWLDAPYSRQPVAA